MVIFFSRGTRTQYLPSSILSTKTLPLLYHDTADVTATHWQEKGTFPAGALLLLQRVDNNIT